MECTLSGNGVKGFHRAVSCLSRVGPELLLEALPDKVTMRSLNSARSAFIAVTLRRHFFDRLQLSSPSAQCSVLLKAVCTVLRTQASNTECLSITLLDNNANKLKWTLECSNGLRKTYWIACNNDIEMQHVALERSTFPSYLIARPRDLSRLLGNFQSSLQEITLIATEPTASEGKAVELRSFIDPAKENKDGALHTQLWIDPAEELRGYHHNGAAVDVTFSVKEVKAFMNFCEGSETDIQIFFEKAGSPVLLAPKFSIDDVENADFDATLVLATMLVSQLGSTESAEQGTEHPSASKPDQRKTPPPQDHSVPNAGAVQASKETPGGSIPRSDHTVIWSELSGTAEQTGHANRVVAEQHQGKSNFPESVDASEELPLHRHEHEPFQKPNDTLEEQTMQENIKVSLPNDGHDDAFMQPEKESSAPQLFGKDLSNWIADSEEEDSDDDDDDGFCVQATPPHRRG